MSVVTLLNNADATGAGSTFDAPRSRGGGMSIQASGTTTAGAGAAVVLLQVSNDGRTFLTLATISLTLATTESSDGVFSSAYWPYVRGNVSSISGTGAAVSLTIGS